METFLVAVLGGVGVATVWVAWRHGVRVALGWLFGAAVTLIAVWLYFIVGRWYDLEIVHVAGDGDPASTRFIVGTGCYDEVRLASLDESPDEVTIRVQHRGVSQGDCLMAPIYVDLQAPIGDRTLFDLSSGDRFAPDPDGSTADSVRIWYPDWPDVWQLQPSP